MSNDTDDETKKPAATTPADSDPKSGESDPKSGESDKASAASDAKSGDADKAAAASDAKSTDADKKSGASDGESGKADAKADASDKASTSGGKAGASDKESDKADKKSGASDKKSGASDKESGKADKKSGAADKATAKEPPAKATARPSTKAADSKVPSMIWTVAKKELRGYFNSAVAVIVLAVFLMTALYAFFWQEKFFARGIADLRPLFEWMPRLLILLVSALSMRMWADERRTGTLEILLTLPIPRWRLVVGKFVSGLLLIAIALALTLPLPLTVSHMGNLDWGPVFGGYLATLLLSAAYLAIGMCVSAATDAQIVAFIVTGFVCSLAYYVGEFGGSLGRFLGTGVRFESVARGVLDLRDLAYYGGIIAIGIALNVLLLSRRTWGTGEATRARRVGAILSVVLVAANAIALDAWLAPVGRARIDLTQSGSYSLSTSTRKILDGLDERLLIRGYFSEKSHPLLAPLVPQIRDLLDEYRVAGGSKVRVEFVDPTDDDDQKREAKERFAIDPQPFQFSDSTEQGIVNAYFAIAIEYGDQRATLGVDDLIQVRSTGVNQTDVTLQNLEYQLTKSIKKAVSEFSSVDTLFASATGKVQLTAYVTPDSLPETLKAAPDKLKKVVDALVKQSHDKLVFTQVEPKTDDEARTIYQKYGIRPFQDLFGGGKPYYFNLLLQVGTRMVRVTPPDNLGEAELKNTIIDGLKRAAPGFTHVVGLAVPPAPPPMPPQFQGMQPQQLPPPQTFNDLKQKLQGNYEVREVNPKQAIPDDIETLILAGPSDYDEPEVEHVDQFVMRGGSLIVLAGKHRITTLGGLGLEGVKSGLDALLEKWGIKQRDELVFDTKNDIFPVPQNRDLGNGMVVREIAQVPYPPFVKIQGDQLGDSVITSGLPGAVMHWASPLTVDAKVGDDTHQVDTLMSSSDEAWLGSTSKIEPDDKQYPGVGFPGPAADAKPDTKGKQILAVTVMGGFASGVATKDKAAAGSGSAAPSKSHLAEHSPPDARIVVFGSSEFVSDNVQGISSRGNASLAPINIELVHNAVDWCLADTDLLSIRGHNQQARVITLDPDKHDTWRNFNLIIAGVLLLLVVGYAQLRRRAVTPIVGKDG